jgi:hypothetical protein
MTRRSIGLMLPPVLMLAFVATASSTPAASGVESRVSRTPTVTGTADNSSSVQAKGRYKKQGDNCEWDANDGGPNQCEPAIKGRFKKGDNDACTWDANDVGADQCRPPKGRWKKGGDNSCAWDANDGGPDQCNPRQARK